MTPEHKEGGQEIMLPKTVDSFVLNSIFCALRCISSPFLYRNRFYGGSIAILERIMRVLICFRKKES